MTDKLGVSPNPKLYTLARLISLVFHPFVVVIPTMILSIYATTSDWAGAIGWTAVCVGFVIAPAILYIRRKLKRKEYTDSDISVRQHRFGIYLFAGVCELLCLATLLIFGAPKILIACFFAAILALIIGMLLNTQTKVSAHMAAMGGCTAVFFYLSPVIGALMLLASLAVAWSRLYLEQHSVVQIIVGWLVAVLSVAVVFYILR